MIEQAEEYVRSLGFGVFRVRFIAQPLLPPLAKIQIEPAAMNKLRDFEPKIRAALRAIGFSELLVDPEGYKAPSAVRTESLPSAAV